jgi:uncharacterized glyoxalase superfamily protein PhnB
MVGDAAKIDPIEGRSLRASPRAVNGANTQSIMVFVDDAEGHCATARAAGAGIFAEPTLHDYGQDYWTDCSYGAVDPEGHRWWFTQRVRSKSSNP